MTSEGGEVSAGCFFPATGFLVRVAAGGESSFADSGSGAGSEAGRGGVPTMRDFRTVLATRGCAFTAEGVEAGMMTSGIIKGVGLTVSDFGYIQDKLDLVMSS